MPLSLPGASFTKGAGSGMLNMLKKKSREGRTQQIEKRERKIYIIKKRVSPPRF